MRNFILVRKLDMRVTVNISYIRGYVIAKINKKKKDEEEKVQLMG